MDTRGPNCDRTLHTAHRAGCRALEGIHAAMKIDNHIYAIDYFY